MVPGAGVEPARPFGQRILSSMNPVLPNLPSHEFALKAIVVAIVSVALGIGLRSHVIAAGLRQHSIVCERGGNQMEEFKFYPQKKKEGSPGILLFGILFLGSWMAGTLKLDGREAEGAEQRCEDGSSFPSPGPRPGQKKPSKKNAACFLLKEKKQKQMNLASRTGVEPVSPP